MTKKELREISEEIRYIDNKLLILDSDNPIEYQERELLINRLGYLKYKVRQALINSKKNRNHLRTGTRTNLSLSLFACRNELRKNQKQVSKKNQHQPLFLRLIISNGSDIRSK